MINIRMPNITANDSQSQLAQIRSYLYQLSGELNWALENIDSSAQEAVLAIRSVSDGKGSAGSKDQAEQAQATFSEVKSLIIKSADIVDAYYDEINRRLEGVYVAESEFGTYMQETSLTINGNPTSIGLMFDNQQAIQTKLEGINGVLETDAEGTTIKGSNAWCKIGVLADDENGFPIYGMEIGQVNSENGQRVYKSFAQYRSDGVHLFDQNNQEVATISNNELVITYANIRYKLILGGYTISNTNGLAFKWAGD